MNRTTRVIITALAAASLALAAGAAPAQARTGPGLTPADAAATSAWIQQAQLPNGALASYPDKQAVLPYVANLAA